MSEIENAVPEDAAPAEAADPAAPAGEEDVAASAAPEVEDPEAAEAAGDEADEDEIDAEPEIALNAVGHPVFAGELFGGADAGQAVYFTETEGISLPVEDEEEDEEAEVEGVA